jgi:hypothetical protein
MAEQGKLNELPRHPVKGLHPDRIIHFQTVGSDIGRLIDDLIDLTHHWDQ